MRDNDGLAAARLAKSAGCVFVAVDTEVKVEDHSILHDAFCVRPRGEPQCLWMLSIAIKTKEDAAIDKAHFKALSDEMNEAFDKDHPECKGWRTDKNLPDYCY
jgi:hypothetical protein